MSLHTFLKHCLYYFLWNRMVQTKTPFFRPNFSSGQPTFSSLSRSGDPTCIFWKKILHLKTNFCQFLAPETQILAKICSGDSSFKPKKISSGDPMFESPGGTYLPNFLATTPLPGTKFWAFWQKGKENKQTKQITIFWQSVDNRCLNFQTTIFQGFQKLRQSDTRYYRLKFARNMADQIRMKVTDSRLRGTNCFGKR